MAKAQNKFPIIVTRDGVTAKVHRRSIRGYFSYRVTFTLFGKREEIIRSDLEEALQLARESCTKVANGIAGGYLTASERHIFDRAKEAAAPVGKSVDDICREYASAHLLVDGSGLSVGDAVREWARRRGMTKAKITVSAAAEQLLKEIIADGKSNDRQKQLAAPLKRLGVAFNVEVHTITPAEISKYLTKLPFADRTKKNHRDIIDFFCRWLVLNEYLEKDADWLKNVQNYSKAKLGEIEIFTVAEITALLVQAGDMTPFLAIAAFSGVRHATICRLDWSMIEFDASKSDKDGMVGFIKIPGKIGKNKNRNLIPIHANLAAWLLPYQKKDGKVVTYKNTTKQLLKIAAKAGVKWKRNALRHSYVSYRLAECNDQARVSDESDNSVQVIKDNYLQRVYPEEAKAWFGVFPASLN